MYYNQAWAAKGHTNGHQLQRQLQNRKLMLHSAQRASVNIYKTENTYEMLVFAPGRIKEHFHIDVNGGELTVSYNPPDGFPRPEWILREYSRGGFKRAFSLDESIDTQGIEAKYTDGVLQITLPVVAGKESVKKEIVIN